MEMKPAVLMSTRQLQAQVSNALVTFHRATVRTKLFKIQSVKAALSCLYTIKHQRPVLLGNHRKDLMSHLGSKGGPNF